jgi:radical SAM superfamily enzyme YgiQ (UPF0313 family)
MNILLLSPPIFDFYFTPARREPLGLLYLRESLKQIDGLNVFLYDSTISRKVKIRAIPEHFEYLKKYYFKDLSLFSLFSTYKRFGDSFTKIINYIVENKIDLVAISSLFSGYHNNVEKLILEIKKRTNALVAVGGWAIEAEKEKLFKESNADFFLYENSEDKFLELVNSLVDNMDNGPKTFDFNVFPQREESFYYFKNKKIAKVAVSRGCKFSCSFCAIHKYNSFKVRTFESIIAELDYLLSIGIEIVDFEDDNLFFNKKWSEKFLDILEDFHKKGLNYTAMNGITAINLVPFTQRAIEVGFIEFNLSLVTTNKTTAVNINRPIFIEQIKEIAKINQNRIDIVVFLIGGLEENTPETLINDIVELAKLPLRIGYSPLYMLPGIEIFEKLGLPENRDLLRGSALYKFGENFTREQVVSLWKFVRMINAIKELDNTPELNENIKNFKKSIIEQVWYYKDIDNTWKKSFEFDLKFPEEIKIKKNDNSYYTLQLNSISDK